MDIDNTFPALDLNLTCGNIDDVDKEAEGDEDINWVDGDGDEHDVEQHHNA